MKVEIKSLNRYIIADGSEVLFNEDYDKKNCIKQCLKVGLIFSLAFLILAVPCFIIKDMAGCGYFLAIFGIAILPIMILSANFTKAHYIITDKELWVIVKNSQGSHTFNELSKVVVNQKAKSVRVVAKDMPRNNTYYLGNNFDNFVSSLLSKLPDSVRVIKK